MGLERRRHLDNNHRTHRQHAHRCSGSGCAVGCVCSGHAATATNPACGRRRVELPFVSRVTNIVGNVITLADNFPATVFDGVTYFWAGGSVVLPVAQRILDYVNALGPSRKSGTADPADPWSDKVLLEDIVTLVMSTKDTDGTRMVSENPGYGTTAGANRSGWLGVCDHWVSTA